MLIPLILAGLFLSSGCTTFGTFSTLKQNQSTSDDVRELLGDPENMRSQETQDIWTYTFAEPYKSRPDKSARLFKALETKSPFRMAS